MYNLGMVRRIVKRDGSLEDFNESKIFKAIKKAFISSNIVYKDENIQILVDHIIEYLNKDATSVEEIQDLVEKSLMNEGYYVVARNYILYRENRAKKRQYCYEIASIVPKFNLYKVLKDIQKDFPDDIYDLSKLLNKYKSFIKVKMSEDEKMHTLIRASLSLMSIDEPNWDYITGRLFMINFNYEYKENIKNYNLNSLLDRLNLYINKFHYDKSLLEFYSEEEILEYEKLINKNRDKYLSYNEINNLIEKYLIHLGEIDFVESIQDFYLVISLLKAKELNKKEEIQPLYESLSKHELSINSIEFKNILKSIER